MAIVKKLYPLVAAMFVFLATSAPAEAQGGTVVCGWCSYGNVEVQWPDGSITHCNGCHAFFGGGDGCAGGAQPWATCSRCGGTSACHRTPQHGPCHILCGPGGDVPRDIRQALADGDASVVASILLRESTEASLQFIPEAGRINVAFACNPGKVFDVIPVLPEMRLRLEAVLLERRALSVGTGTVTTIG